MDVWGTPLLADVEEIVTAIQHELRAQGSELLETIKPTYNNIMVTCIAHGDGIERNPSLGISLKDKRDYRGEKIPAGTCHCFTCGYKADLPTFVSNAFGYNDKGMYGYKWIMKNFVSIAIDERPKIQLDMGRDKRTAETTETGQIDEEQLEEYRYTHPYMYRRKLTDKVIEYFDLGYDAEKGAITFPVHDVDGKVKLIQRRSVYGKMFINDEGGSKGNYLYGLHQVYKNLSWINEIYITESPVDALTLWTYRIPAVALMGARATAQQVELLQKLPVRKMVIALDNDSAGHKGADFLKDHLKTNKLLYRLQFPENVKDINDMTEKQINNRQEIIFY